MKKKSQISSHTVLYTLLLIIFAFVLLMGYQFVKDINESEGKRTLILFKSELANDAKSVDYGDVKIETYEVPNNVDKICFSEPKNSNPLLCPNCPSADDFPILANAISDGASENVFLISGSIPETAELEDITIGCCEFVCFNVAQGRVKLRLEGQDKKTLIEGT